ncbi:MAG TPA: cytochrome c [Longimicrobiales bacterium]|nr:cytochrome c [Longimicrobiales bacterium]
MGLIRMLGAMAIGVVVTLLLLAGAAYGVSEYRMTRVWEVQPRPLADSIELGMEEASRLATVHGCVECHGEDLGGGVLTDDPAFGRIIAPNLTSGGKGAGSRYNTSDWVRAIRHGIDPQGHGLVLMPSEQYYYLPDEQIAAIIDYVEAAEPVSRELGDTRLGPLARALYAGGMAQLLAADVIDHDRPPPPPPAAGVTEEYGAFLARACQGCHGQNLAGGASGPAPAPNLTPHATGLGPWSEEDFRRAMREGLRPDSSEISEAMPWKAFRAMTDEELSALWLYLRSVPAVAPTE